MGKYDKRLKLGCTDETKMLCYIENELAKVRKELAEINRLERLELNDGSTVPMDITFRGKIPFQKE